MARSLTCCRSLWMQVRAKRVTIETVEPVPGKSCYFNIRLRTQVTIHRSGFRLQCIEGSALVRYSSIGHRFKNLLSDCLKLLCDLAFVLGGNVHQGILPRRPRPHAAQPGDNPELPHGDPAAGCACGAHARLAIAGVIGPAEDWLWRGFSSRPESEAWARCLWQRPQAEVCLSSK